VIVELATDYRTLEVATISIEGGRYIADIAILSWMLIVIMSIVITGELIILLAAQLFVRR